MRSRFVPFRVIVGETGAESIYMREIALRRIGGGQTYLWGSRWRVDVK
jgi:hypothetical protein